MDVSAISTSSSAVPTMTSSTSEQVKPVVPCAKAGIQQGSGALLFSVPTPCRGRHNQSLKSPSSELADLVDTVVTLKTRLSAIQPDRLPSAEANSLLEPLQKFELMLRAQMKET